jgi:hypothetical protein
MASSLTTSTYGFPYPDFDDLVDVAGDLGLLAVDLDEKLSGIVIDVVGLMVSNNEETGINVIFDEPNNKLDFVLDLDYIKNNVANMFEHPDHIGINAVYNTVSKQVELEVTGGGVGGGSGTSSLTNSWWLGV